jgi:phosphate/sulfate permease
MITVAVGVGVGVIVGTSVVGTRIIVADGEGVGEATSKVGDAVQVDVFTEDVLVGTFGTLSGFPVAIKVELPIQFARCRSTTVTR